ncbi:hypothetical protein OQA88_13358 [Cercophora sp. LCS_1]
MPFTIPLVHSTGSPKWDGSRVHLYTPSSPHPESDFSNLVSNFMMASLRLILAGLASFIPLGTANSTIPLPSISTDSYHTSTPLGSLILHNGTIHTQNPSQPLASVLAISNGLITYVGTNLTHALSLPFSSPPLTVNLQNRTTIPGLIDCHNHIVLLGSRPGHHTPLEHTPSIASLLQTYGSRTTTVPPGEFITTIGGFHPNQFTELRLPTLAELDTVTPNHPVFVSIGFNGPAVTNTLGRSIFSHHNITIHPNGTIASGAPNNQALNSLRANSTSSDRERSVLAAMHHAASVGITTHLDQGAFPSSGNPSSDGAASADLTTMHFPFLSVYAAGRALVRLRLNFLHMDAPSVLARLQNTFPFFGNSMLRTGAIGEFHVAQTEYAGGPVFEASAKQIAEAGWRLEVHSLTATDFRGQIESFENVDRQVHGGISDLRWVVAHVPRITDEYLGRLKRVGGGVNLSGWNYLAGAGNESSPAGPPFRRIKESGVRAGFGADGANIAPLSPWPHFYYAVTGRNARGEVINGGQTVEREDVLRWYTRDNTWFLGGPDEKLLGILEVGRLGDVVVLSDDLFGVEDEKLKSLSSVLTVVGGVVVYDTGVLKR